jgi:CheY-like chemotaxis protein
MAEHHDDDEMPTNEGEGYVVMLVESKAGLQNAVREKLKSRGYRVLIISDPARALARFSPEEDPPADCVLFGASELGVLAMEAFNQFASDEHTADIPAVLLADHRQTQVISNAVTDEKRQLLSLPLKVRELRNALKALLRDVQRREIGTY